MKINAFQIKNYRSIIDSHKCYLSPDYITALIGQNESGKTSVLEALRSFYEGTITDDVLRSDLTFPEITCSFTLDGNKTLGDYIDLVRLPEELHPIVVPKKEVSLTRKWINSKTCAISIAEEEIINFYNNLENNRIESSNKIIGSIPELIKLTEIAARELQASENAVATSRVEINTIHNRYEESRKALNKLKIRDQQVSAEQEIENIKLLLEESEKDLKEKLSWLEARKSNLQLLTEKLSICKSFNELSLKVQATSDDLLQKINLVHDAEHQLDFYKNEKQNKPVIKRLEQLREMQLRLQNELRNLVVITSKTRRTAEKMLSGKKQKDAAEEAALEHDLESGYISIEELGNGVFKYVPMFEFFEDFSSLLPNKIDLDDLLNENMHAEGYKAARNFLCIAGLNADFFREKNHRILKQKIENLNSEITIDFQDYWRQSVGKDDKIRINFELEHYDNSQPDKSGKPYLEFWIKDKQERLYPKQRSRGVRWFLSFYLELKATAKEKKVNRIMLIDEPGLSLHARAQEDVLKVFEDLKENLQIIYSTHSPNLIDLKKLYRIIAVQRARESDEKSETIVHDARTLSEASSDTLSPIYALMGTRLNDRQFIFPKNNLIVEDSVTFHYLEAISGLYGLRDEVHFIPASGPDMVPLMANILFGWNVDFRIVLTDNAVSSNLGEFLKANTFYSGIEGFENKVIVLQGFLSIEDMFSTIDFKRFVLKQRGGITVKNSEYIETNKLSRMILVSDFHSKIKSENTQYSDFDEETRANFDNLFSFFCKPVVKE
jgi:predicted ATP-dependent endonuclease of OLD family